MPKCTGWMATDDETWSVMITPVRSGPGWGGNIDGNPDHKFFVDGFTRDGIFHRYGGPTLTDAKRLAKTKIPKGARARFVCSSHAPR